MSLTGRAGLCSEGGVRVYAWNVNGLRAAAKKGFLQWLGSSRGQIVAVQEVRARAEQLPAEVRRPSRWHSELVAADKKGYSGVATYSRYRFDEVETSLSDPALDIEGRVLAARFGALWVVNAYFPNGNGSVLPSGRRSNDRVPYKLQFSRRVFDVLAERFEAGAPILVLGDFNTAPAPIDLARPKDNRGTSGFLPEERGEMARWLDAGWVDTFRYFHPEATGRYTWWAQRNQCRERNIGWRIDHILASPGAVPYLRAARIHPKVLGSDHCPISVDLDPAVRSARVEIRRPTRGLARKGTR